MTSKQRICIIGAGTAGLCALKHSLEHGLEATCYEQAKEIGGTWVYSEKITNIPYEGDDHSSMYEGLRTNLPKEVMGYPDYPYPDSCAESFVSSADVLAFLQSYAEHFKLKSNIKFQHVVIRVRPRNKEWEVYVWDVLNGTYDAFFFDFVFVCNGHYTTPLYPKIEGMDIYGGHQLHSHSYRKPSDFKGEKVLIIGAGPSGMDITEHVHKSAEHIFLSNHLEPPPNTNFMQNVTQKPDVERFTDNGAIFKDGSSENFNHVIFCTGYKYSFPCLSTDCDIRVTKNYVQPLYKHCININHPTMALIGLPSNVSPSLICDMQVRFALKFFTNQKQLPSQAVMLEDMELKNPMQCPVTIKQHQTHELGKKQFDYFQNLSETAEITNIKPVIQNILSEFADCSRKYIYELESYRNTTYKIIDDETYVKCKTNTILN